MAGELDPPTLLSNGRKGIDAELGARRCNAQQHPPLQRFDSGGARDDAAGSAKS